MGRRIASSYQSLDSVWQTGAEFLARYEPGEETGTFFHPASGEEALPAAAKAGEILSVTLRFLDRNREFDVHARVLERVVERGRCGLKLAFLPEERKRQELVLICARGESLPYFKRRYQRISCQLPVLLTAPGGNTLECNAVGISEGGARLDLASDEVSEDAIVSLAISFAGPAPSLTLRARVAAVTRSGPLPAIGIEFLFESEEQRTALQSLVQALRAADTEA